MSMSDCVEFFPPGELRFTSLFDCWIFPRWTTIYVLIWLLNLPQVNYEGDPEAALVQFSSNAEALSCYRSSEPLFNNRFVKVFWHKNKAEVRLIRVGIAYCNNARTLFLHLYDLTILGNNKFLKNKRYTWQQTFSWVGLFWGFTLL